MTGPFTATINDTQLEWNDERECYEYPAEWDEPEDDDLQGYAEAINEAVGR